MTDVIAIKQKTVRPVDANGKRFHGQTLDQVKEVAAGFGKQLSDSGAWLTPMAKTALIGGLAGGVKVLSSVTPVAPVVAAVIDCVIRYNKEELDNG